MPKLDSRNVCEAKISDNSVTKLKDEGNRLYKLRKFDSAITVYTNALSILDSQTLDNPQPSGNLELIATLYSNRAAAYLHSNRYSLCIRDSDLGLRVLSNVPRGNEMKLFTRLQNRSIKAREKLERSERVARAALDALSKNNIQTSKDVEKLFDEAIAIAEQPLTHRRSNSIRFRHVAKLLSGRSKIKAQRMDFSSALVDATAASQLDPSQERIDQVCSLKRVVKRQEMNRKDSGDAACMLYFFFV